MPEVDNPLRSRISRALKDTHFQWGALDGYEAVTAAVMAVVEAELRSDRFEEAYERGRRRERADWNPITGRVLRDCQELRSELAAALQALGAARATIERLELVPSYNSGDVSSDVLVLEVPDFDAALAGRPLPSRGGLVPQRVKPSCPCPDPLRAVDPGCPTHGVGPDHQVEMNLSHRDAPKRGGNAMSVDAHPPADRCSICGHPDPDQEHYERFH